MIKNKKGFTLIELMIVMAIIGILAVIALVAIAGKSVDARDSRRLADANAIQFTFALHAIEHGSDYLEGAWPGVLLNDLGNKADIADMMNLDGVKDPIDGRTDICYDGAGMVLQCNQAGGYTVFDMYDDLGDLYLGTFDNYAIGIKLESTESIAYFENFDWRKLMGVKTANAATCGNLICETADEEHMAFSPNYCPGDCPCNQDWDCDAGEEQTWCSCDCGGFMGCGPFVCGDLMCNWGEINTCPGDCAPAVCGDGNCSPAEMLSGTCPADCGGGGGEGDYDENDWLYIGPGGVNRTSFDGIDLYNYTYSD